VGKRFFQKVSFNRHLPYVTSKASAIVVLIAVMLWRLNITEIRTRVTVPLQIEAMRGA